ncbi:MAG: hypothetical protein LBE13_03175 [Bacteroidales bacterium]|nr:hypothetical protein [Bacteroidales bacterium]
MSGVPGKSSIIQEAKGTEHDFKVYQKRYYWKKTLAVRFPFTPTLDIIQFYTDKEK